MRAESTMYSETLVPVVVSCTRRRCLSTASDTKAKRSPEGENAENVSTDDEFSNTGRETTGRPFALFFFLAATVAIILGLSYSFFLFFSLKLNVTCRYILSGQIRAESSDPLALFRSSSPPRVYLSSKSLISFPLLLCVHWYSILMNYIQVLSSPDIPSYI